MKKILIILGHSDKKTFCGSLAEAYAQGAKSAGHKVKQINLGELNFDPILHKGYHKIQELEPDLIKAQKDITWADHIVIIFPTWWASFPAILKGFIDRVFLPGFGFKYRDHKILWDRLLKGRSGHVITTMDAPKFFYTWGVCSAGVHVIKNGTLKFCGISPVKVTKIGRVRKMSEGEKEKVIGKVKLMAKKV